MIKLYVLEVSCPLELIWVTSNGNMTKASSLYTKKHQDN